MDCSMSVMVRIALSGSPGPPSILSMMGNTSWGLLLLEHAHLHLLPVFGPFDLTSRSELEGTTPVRTVTELRALAATIQAVLQAPSEAGGFLIG